MRNVPPRRFVTPQPDNPAAWWCSGSPTFRATDCRAAAYSGLVVAPSGAAGRLNRLRSIGRNTSLRVQAIDLAVHERHEDPVHPAFWDAAPTSHVPPV
jgi:hypothetical protein